MRLLGRRLVVPYRYQSRSPALFGASPVAIANERQTAELVVAATLSDAAAFSEPKLRSVPGARDDADVNVASEAESDAMPSDPVEAAVLESSASSVIQVAPGARKATHSAAVFGSSSVAIASQRRTAKLETGTPSDRAPLSKSKARSTPAAQDEANENASFGSP